MQDHRCENLLLAFALKLDVTPRDQYPKRAQYRELKCARRSAFAAGRVKQLSVDHLKPPHSTPTEGYEGDVGRTCS
jgi:hypothetical protein